MFRGVWLPVRRALSKRSQICTGMFGLRKKRGLRYNGDDTHPGAQTMRWGMFGPVRNSVGGWDLTGCLIDYSKTLSNPLSATGSSGSPIRTDLRYVGG